MSLGGDMPAEMYYSRLAGSQEEEINTLNKKIIELEEENSKLNLKLTRAQVNLKKAESYIDELEERFYNG